MDVELSVELRSKTGKGAARVLRRAEKVPAVLYGPKMEAMSISVSAKRLERLLRDMGEESKLLRLNIEGGEETVSKQVLIREVQVHPMRRRFFHVDFFEVPLDQAIVVDVPVELTGEAIGVKKGGTLNLVRRMLSVRCLPGDIPEKVHVDISAMDIGDSIHVSDLLSVTPFELVQDPGHSVVNIAAPEGAGKESEGE